MNVSTATVKSVTMSSASLSALGLGNTALRPGCSSVGMHVIAPIAGLSESACVAGGPAAKLAGGHLGSDAPWADLGLQISVSAGLRPEANDCHGAEQATGSISVNDCAPLAEKPLCADNNFCVEPLPLQSSWLFREDM